jgi:hypothetical protein
VFHSSTNQQIFHNPSRIEFLGQCTQEFPQSISFPPILLEFLPFQNQSGKYFLNHLLGYSQVSYHDKLSNSNEDDSSQLQFKPNKTL